MPTPPRRWPIELERERDETIQEAAAAAQCLIEAKEKTDSARTRINTNPSLAIFLLSEADRSMSDALASLERIQRSLSICKGTAIKGRWPNVATRQRDEAIAAAQTATSLLSSAEETIIRATEKVQSNPGLSEIVVVDIARTQARAMVLIERIARLMTEATMGRD